MPETNNRPRTTELQATQLDFLGKLPPMKGAFDYSNVLASHTILTVKGLESTIQEANQYLLATQSQHDAFKRHPQVLIKDSLSQQRTQLEWRIGMATLTAEGNTADKTTPVDIQSHQDNIEAALTVYQGSFEGAQASVTPPVQAQLDFYRQP